MIPRRDILRALQDDLPEKVKECEKSVREDNPEMDRSTAIAICQDMHNRGVLAEFLEAAPADGADTDTAELAALAQFRNPGDIRRVDLDGSAIRYESVMLLAPGAWTDAGSRSTAIYAAEGIRASAENFVDPATGEPVDEASINLLHGPALHGAASLGDVGSIPTESVVVDDQDRLFADLELHGETAASELAIELMDETLEAADDPEAEAPPVGPSVEIVDERSEPDPDTGAPRLTEMWFSGVGIVFNPASRPVEIEQQAQERAIAMAEAAGLDETDHAGIVLQRDGDVDLANDAGDGSSGSGGVDEDGETVLTGSRHGRSMSETERAEIQKLLGEMQRLLQDDGIMETVATLIEQYRQAGEDLQDPVSEFMSWAAENSDIDPDELQDVADAYLESVEAESLDVTPVEGLQGWLDEQMGDGGNDENGDEGDEGDEGGMSEEDLREAVDTIQTFSSELESVKDMLQEFRGDVDEDLEELEEQIEETDRRLQEIEDEPIRQAQEHRPGTDFVDDEDGEAPADHEDVML